MFQSQKGNTKTKKQRLKFDINIYKIYNIERTIVCFASFPKPCTILPYIVYLDERQRRKKEGGKYGIKVQKQTRRFLPTRKRKENT